MDSITLKYYIENATELADVYNSASNGISNYFEVAFSKGDRVIDIGCGSGRDLNKLHKFGLNAFGIEICSEWIETAYKNFPEIKGKITLDSLPDLKTLDNNSFDGILCSAVLMHLPKENLFDCAFNLRRILKENGRLLISIPVFENDSSIDSKTNRDIYGRLFNGIIPENLLLIFERLGFNLIYCWKNDDSLGRTERKWSTMLLGLQNRSGIRPIDTIESILNRDNKVATYKLALFRALAEIAMTNYNIAVWQLNGKVKVPIEVIANKWIEYYWPIIESEKTIPQTTGKPVAFNNSLSMLIKHYNSQKGGLSRFCLEYRNNDFTVMTELLLKDVMADVKKSIKQPVKYAGSGEHFSVFQYDKMDKTVVLDSSIWRELSLTGTWILDATILRWAELTSKISKGSVKTSEVIDLLLVNPLPEREISSAKQVYDKLENKICVWSEKILNQEYDIDHAIPFALWHNNDLWNLLPANSKINNSKRDKLPTNELVKARKDSIIYYWEILHQNYQYRFESEMKSFCGNGTYGYNWKNNLFNCFSEAIEVAAVQRGVERWTPDNCQILINAKSFKNNLMQVENDALESCSEYENSVALPFFPNLEVACGAFKEGYPEGAETMSVPDLHNNLDPKRHFVVKASGDSMSWGNNPICDGDLLLMEINTGGTISNQIFMVEYIDDFGNTSHVLKRIEKNSAGEYRLVSKNRNYSDIIVNSENMFPIARFIKVIQEES